MTACAVRSRRVWQSATVGFSLLLVPAGTPVGAEPKTQTRLHKPVPGIKVAGTRVAQPLVIPRTLRAEPPSNLILRLPDFGDRLPLFLWPVQGPVTSGFGLRRSGWHRGIDIQADRGTPIAAAASGLVIASGIEHRYGRVVKIEHINGFVTVYAHNERNLVSIGDRVLTGQTIATIGRSGRATAPHLHFEIRHEGSTYNPLYLLDRPDLLAATTAPEAVPDDLSDH